MKKVLSAIMAACLFACMLTGCEKKPQYEKFNGSIWEDCFDTIVSVVSYNTSQEEFDKMMEFTKSEFQRLHRLYDIYHNYHDLNNAKTINDNAGIAPVKVDKELFDLIKFGIDWHNKTDGKINIAMGSVLKIWHDVREDAEPVPPKLSDLQAANEHTDINSIVLDEENLTVFITDPQVSIDLGAVAKGYATEIISKKLAETYPSFAISAGGNVRVNGSPMDDRTRWGIGIQNPLVDENYQMIGGNLDLAFLYGSQSLVCSGGYQRFFVYEGERYHHLIDPVTLFPENIYYGVSILCEDSGVADALSTAVFMMQPQQALDFINGIDGAECILVTVDGETFMTDGFKAYLQSCGVNGKTPIN